MRLPDVKLYPQGLQLIPGQGVEVCCGVGDGCGVWVGVTAGLGVGVCVGGCVGICVGKAVGTAVLVTLARCCAIGLLSVLCCCEGGGVVVTVAILLLTMAAPMHKKKRRRAMSVPHPKLIFVFRLLALYHLQRFERGLPDGIFWKGGYGNCPGWSFI